MEEQAPYGCGDASGTGMTGRRPCCGSRHRRGGAGRGALVEPAVIAALMSGGGHGYDLRRAITEMTADQIEVDQGGLYRVLRRLEEEGYVASVWAEGDSGPQRREYEVTPRAAEIAHDWVAHLRERERLASMLADLLEAALAGDSLAADEPTGSGLEGDR